MSAAADERAPVFHEDIGVLSHFHSRAHGIHVVDPHFMGQYGTQSLPIGEIPAIDEQVVQTHLFRFGLHSVFRPKEDEEFASFLDASWAAAAGNSLFEEPHCIEAARSQRPESTSLISQFGTTNLSS
ncbi:MAG: hypothetical protein ACLT98_12535 [Eggerthellaceae bacterium]